MKKFSGLVLYYNNYKFKEEEKNKKKALILFNNINKKMY